MGFYSEIIFPWLLEKLEGDTFSDLRKRCVGNAVGHVLEIGFGTGKTLEHYSEKVKSLTVLEPSEGMLKKAKAKIEQSKINAEVLLGFGENLPFPDERFDAVTITITLCSVDDPMKVIQEIKRVLKKGGKFYFLEHVVSKNPKWRKRQRRLNPLQRVFGCGCNLTRDTLRTIQGSGFVSVDFKELIYEHMPIHPQLFPLILGVATK